MKLQFYRYHKQPLNLHLFNLFYFIFDVFNAVYTCELIN
jgi:hypothetical protein